MKGGQVAGGEEDGLLPAHKAESTDQYGEADGQLEAGSPLSRASSTASRSSMLSEELELKRSESIMAAHARGKKCQRWWILLLCWAAWFSRALADSLPGAMEEKLMENFTISKTTYGSIFSIAYFAGGLLVMTTTLLTDRFGITKVLMYNCILTALAQAAMAASVYFKTFNTFMIARFVGGFSSVYIVACVMSLIGRWFRYGDGGSGFPYAIARTGGFAALIVVFGVVPKLLGVISFNQTYIAMSAIGATLLAVAGVLVFWMDDEGDQVEIRTLRKTIFCEDNGLDSVSGASVSGVRAIWLEFKEFISKAKDMSGLFWLSLWPLAAGGNLQIFSAFGIDLWQTYYGVDYETAGFYVGLHSTQTATVGILTGWLISRSGRWPLWITLSGGMTIGAFTLLLLGRGGSPVPTICALSIAHDIWAISWGMIYDMVDEELTPLAMAICTCVWTNWAAVVPLIVAGVLDTTKSWRSVILVVMGMFVAQTVWAAALWIYACKTDHRVNWGPARKQEMDKKEEEDTVALLKESG